MGRLQYRHGQGFGRGTGRQARAGRRHLADPDPGLMAKQYDIVMVDMWATPERGQTVVFTEPYNVYGWAVMIRSDLAASKWEDLDTSATTISVLSGTADEQ